MAKRRYNAKKIARQPNLKKRMARFCAMVDVKYTPDLKINFEEILTNGHRDYIVLGRGANEAVRQAARDIKNQVQCHEGC